MHLEAPQSWMYFVGVATGDSRSLDRVRPAGQRTAHLYRNVPVQGNLASAPRSRSNRLPPNLFKALSTLGNYCCEERGLRQQTFPRALRKSQLSATAAPRSP